MYRRGCHYCKMMSSLAIVQRSRNFLVVLVFSLIAVEDGLQSVEQNVSMLGLSDQWWTEANG